jgi:hypothetical protein
LGCLLLQLLHTLLSQLLQLCVVFAAEITVKVTCLWVLLLLLHLDSLLKGGCASPWGAQNPMLQPKVGV